MRLIELERRLARIESGRREGAPTAILSARPPGIGPEIRIEDYRAWIADGLGIVVNSVLYIPAPEMTVEEWATRHVTEH